MSFNSLVFLVFFSVLLILYYTLFRRYQKQLLLVASICFYCFAGPQHILYILAASGITYFCARKIAVSDKKRAARFLKVDFLLIFGIFIFLRYFNFLSTTVCSFGHLWGADSSPFLLKIIVPLGLSYYTLTNIGYVLDVYWKRIPAEEKFLSFLLFTIYFPHIVQGPISRYHQLAPQFDGEKAFDYERVTQGLQLMLWGYFKKMVIADRLNIFVSRVFEEYQSHNGVIFAVAMLFYSVQIYADFSGCMDIVGGVSETFGIRLEKNFDHPYFSRTIPEFWRRWHITLGAWFKDYVYYPISISGWMKKSSKYIRKSRGGRAGRMYMSCIPTIIVWLLTGLWHGSSWNFVLWGMFHAVLMTSGILFAEPLQKITRRLRIDTGAFSWKLFQMSRTFILCSIGRVFFRAADLSTAIGIFRRMFSQFGIWQLFDGSLYRYGLDRPNFILALLGIGLLWCVSMLQEHLPVRATLARQNIVFRWMIYYAAIFSILIFGIYGPGYDASAFIYNQF